MRVRNFTELSKKIAARGGIVVFFIMAFEVMIMISPFAFFFYSVFNPILHWFQDYSATRWLTSFFLPHMILPPTMFLRAVRILGSVLFVAGSLTFFVCAFQVYFGKIFKLGVASKGLYCVIRHPQYLALGLWGTGMSILWPRFLVLVSLSFMFMLYYFLARDEERRMLGQFGKGYSEYMDRTGMFLHRRVENFLLIPFRYTQQNVLRHASICFSIIVIVIGSGFLLRFITLHSIGLSTAENITILPILTEDTGIGKRVLEKITAENGTKRLEFIDSRKDYLAYLIPGDYVMQGMLADTGGEFHLHTGHNTFALITDWVLHPFEHLRQSPSVRMAEMHGVDPAFARRHHCPIGIDEPKLSCENCPYRRIIFIEIDHEGSRHIPSQEMLSMGVSRIPVGFIDINTSTGEVVRMKMVGKGTAWKDVPTPAI